MSGTFSHATRALKHTAYRRFFIAQGCSLVGTWVQLVAMSWLVWRLSHSAAWLGWTGFASQIPILFLAPFAGVWSDRFDRRKLLMVTQVLSLTQSVLLAVLVWTHTAQPWHCVVLAGTLGCINAFDTPIRQSFTVMMVVDKKDMPSAIALNSFMFNLARLIGPSIAGFMISAFSETACFLLNSVSYVGVIAVLYSLRLKNPPARPHNTNILFDLREGVHYAFHHPVIGRLLAQLMLLSLLIAPYVQLMPIFASQVFVGDARVLGLLIGAAGFGAVSATLFLATRGGIDILPTIIAGGSLTAGLCLALFSQSQSLPFSMLMMVGVGAGIISTAASTNTLVQHTVEDDKRGRVMSLYTICFLGIAPIGSLILGHLSEVWTAPIVLLCAGILCLLGTLRYLSNIGKITKALTAAPSKG
jgi:MFS family permease